MAAERKHTRTDDLDAEDDGVEVDRSLSNVIIVDGLPIVPSSKYARFQGAIKELFANWGNIIDDGFYIPMDGDKTQGYAFIEYENEEQAQFAVGEAKGYEFQQGVFLSVNIFDDFDAYLSQPDRYEAPKRDAFEVKANLNSWMLDDLGRDQFVLRFGRETQIYWNDPLRRPGDFGRELKYGGEKQKADTDAWTQSYTQWSPRGSYLATFHSQGIALWGGDEFTKLGRVKHRDVKLIDFSPSEKYLVTTNGEDKQFAHDPDCIIVWDVRTGKELRGFDKIPLGGGAWPAFKWSHDDRFVARISEDLKMPLEIKVEAINKQLKDHDAPTPKAASAPSKKLVPRGAVAAPKKEEKKEIDPRTIEKKEEADRKAREERAIAAEKYAHEKRYLVSIYETPTMKLLDNKAIRIEGVQEIAWSPTNSTLAYWVNERENVPARIVLLELPSKRVLREKHLVNVADIKLHWSTDGDYLCVKLVKQLTKKKTSTNFEIFCMRKRDIPVEVAEVSDNVTAFAWEPRGSRFAIIHNDGMHMTQSVSFYQLKKEKLKLLGTLKDRSCNTLFWSPAGNYIVMATLGGSQASGSNGGLEFFDVNNLETVATGDHFLCTDVEWDPSGRYVITAATQPIPAPGAPWKYTQESGYRVWSLQGTLLATCTQEHLYQANWRPRPPTLVEKKREEELKGQLVNKERVWKTFAEEDEKLSKGHEADLKRERQKMKSEWRAYRTQCEAEYTETAADRAELRGGVVSDDDDDYLFQDQEVEEIVETIEEVVG